MKQLAVGKPLPIEKLPPTTGRGHDWLTFLKSIPRNYAQQVSASQGGTMEAIRRLEAQGVIERDEFTVRSRNEENQRKVFVLHNERTGKRHKERKLTETGRVILKDEDAEKYILAKPDFEYSLAEIHTQFFGRILKPRGVDNQSYHQSYGALWRTRQKIEKEHGGKFVTVKRPDGTTAYRFQKNA